MRALFEPGFFASAPVHVALAVGALSALVGAVVGVFTVVRGQSFAGHALTDVATTGGSGAYFYGASPLAGFLAAGVLGAGAMEVVGVERLRGRDVATGVVLGFATGLSALFLYLDATKSASTGVSQQVLFGSIFTLSASTIPVVSVMSALTLGAVFAIYRPLVLSSVSPDLAAARGIRVRALGVAFMAALAVAVGLSAIAIGSILSTALLVGPAASALRVTKSLRGAIALAAGWGVVATWLGVLFAFDSYYWSSSHQALPVSFFIVALVFVGYVAAGLLARWRGAHADTHRTGR